MRFHHHLAAVLAACLLANTVQAGAAVERSLQSIEVRGKKVRMELFFPAGKEKVPAIVLLHDSSGMTLLPGTIFRECSRILAREGFAVVLVHYFDSTGHTSLRPEEVRQAKQHWDVWLDAVRLAVRKTAEHPRIDADRIGVLGFSLGAYLATAAATDRALNVAAVAEFFGGLPTGFHKLAGNLPPVLIVHGKSDNIVPPDEAEGLQKLLAAHKVPVEVRFYNCGHLFLGAQLRWSRDRNSGSLFEIDGDIADARDRTVRFFNRYLRRRNTARK